MKNRRGIPFLGVVSVLIGIFVLLAPASRSMRAFMVGITAPFWALFDSVKKGDPSRDRLLQEEIDNLRRENQFLVAQIEEFKEWLWDEERIEEQMRRFPVEMEGSIWKKRREQSARLLELQVQAVAAKVVYRDPSFWSSFLWINVGEETNKGLQKNVIRKNSPVVLGKVLIGLVDEVGATRSKVRLIGDSKLHVAVRVLRGGSEQVLVAQRAEALLQLLQGKSILPSPEENRVLLSSLYRISLIAETSSEDVYLAKGELYGNSLPLWRSRGQVLKGVGFNYDFPDEEGPARDLRTGAPVGAAGDPAILLQEGDLLVTSGLDGLFPPGLEVATVSQIAPLPEGGYAYEIQAQSLILNFHELSTIFVLPPVAL